MLDPEIAVLSERSWYAGQSASQMTYIARVPLGLQCAVDQIAGWPMRTVTLAIYSAPPVGQKANQVYPVRKQTRTQMDTTPGAAPTAGIYTGIPSGCSGGNPYS